MPCARTQPSNSGTAAQPLHSRTAQRRYPELQQMSHVRHQLHSGDTSTFRLNLYLKRSNMSLKPVSAVEGVLISTLLITNKSIFRLNESYQTSRSVGRLLWHLRVVGTFSKLFIKTLFFFSMEMYVPYPRYNQLNMSLWVKTTHYRSILSTPHLISRFMADKMYYT